MSPDAPPIACWLGLQDFPTPFPIDTPNYLAVLPRLCAFSVGQERQVADLLPRSQRSPGSSLARSLCIPPGGGGPRQQVSSPSRRGSPGTGSLQPLTLKQGTQGQKRQVKFIHSTESCSTYLDRLGPFLLPSLQSDPAPWLFPLSPGHL